MVKKNAIKRPKYIISPYFPVKRDFGGTIMAILGVRNTLANTIDFE